ncbi:hypothetical protein LA080_005711 [Diaporthe eres]|nr:hypothetical protein LA080_005711 [Diaporthe eres]
MDHIFSAKFDKYKPRRDNVPRILLRGWHPGTAAAALGLNTGRGIYPFAWQCLLPEANTRVSREPPKTPLAPHRALDGGSNGSGPEPHLHFGHLQWEMNDAPGYIAVVNSSRPRPRPIIHVPDLGWQSLPQEYLIYGPVTEGIRVVSINTIRETLNCEHWPFCHIVRREPHTVTEEEIRDSPAAPPRPLGPAELARAERQQTRPWPEADFDNILSSRLLVHKGAVPPLSGAVLGNALTTWGPARDTAGTSPPVLTRAQWVAAFKAAANRHSPSSHDCGPIRCDFCGKTHVGATATDWLKFKFSYFCSQQCYDSQARKERAEGNQNSVQALQFADDADA